jgi:glutamate-5-semialdehyde dehydrogenase
MTIHADMVKMAEQALQASRALALLTTDEKNAILNGMADEVDTLRTTIQAANEKDLIAGQRDGLSKALLDRLELTPIRIDAMITGIREVAALPDPVGGVIEERVRPNGLTIRRVRVPIGVIGIIYESRPNVTADASSLCFKSSNAVILRGGKESIYSNTAITAALQAGGKKMAMPEHAIQALC